MKTLALSLVALTCTPVLAATSGAISGTATGRDCRDDPYLRSGHSRNQTAGSLSGARQFFPDNGQRVLEEIMIRVQAANLSTGAGQDFYGRTNSSGNFSIAWSTNFDAEVVTVTLMAKRPNIGATTVQTPSEPAEQFGVYSGGSINVAYRQFDVSGFPGGSGNINSSFTITSCSEILNVYYTAREMYGLFATMGTPFVGGSTTSDMFGLHLDTNYPGGSGGGTPTDSQIFLGAGTGVSLPETVAHEIGHALVWRSLDQSVAVINGTTDYWCYDDGGNSTWRAFSQECDRAAFHEGLADSISALWMWFRTADPPGGNPNFLPDSSSGGVPIDLESAGTCGDGSGPDYRKPFCSARAMWDIMDNSPTDGDGITSRDLSDVVGVLRSYQRGCWAPWDNRCANEAGYDAHGNNWKDFKWNWANAGLGQSSEMNSIESNNGLGGQVDD